MPILIDDRKKNTRLPDILRAALKLFVQKGIDGTTIKDIARMAGVAEGALYRHYKSKEELAGTLFETNLLRFTGELQARLDGVRGTKEKLRAYMETVAREYESDPELFYYMILSEHLEIAEYVNRKKLRHIGHVLEDVIQAGQKAGEVKPGRHLVLVALVLGGLHRLCLIHRYGLLGAPVSKEIPALHAAAWAAVKAQGGK